MSYPKIKKQNQQSGAVTFDSQFPEVVLGCGGENSYFATQISTNRPPHGRVPHGVHLTGVHFMGVYLMGVQLIGVYLWAYTS
jgi:hypothetical protein